MRALAPIVVVLALAACAQGGPAGVSGPDAPVGAPPGADAVDGLTVGHRLMEAGEPELALRAFLRAAAGRGTDVDVLSALGSANLRLGRLGQAEALLRRAVAEDPSFAPAWNNLGVVLMESGQVAEASRVFRVAVAADSGESDDMRANLARALASLNEASYPRRTELGATPARRRSGALPPDAVP